MDILTSKIYLTHLKSQKQENLVKSHPRWFKSSNCFIMLGNSFRSQNRPKLRGEYRQVCLPVFETTFVPLRYIIFFFLLWYSSIFPYLYFTVSLISVCFKWLSNTYLTSSSTAVTRYCSWFLTYTVIYDGRFRLTQVIEGNT